MSTVLRYPDSVAETFAERLARFITEAGISDAELGAILGISEKQAQRLKDGTTKSLKFEPALRLCRRLRLSPWALAGEPDPLEEAEGPGGLKIRREGERIDVIPAPGQVIYGGSIDELADTMADAMLPVFRQILRRRAGADPKRLALVDQLFGPDEP